MNRVRIGRIAAVVDRRSPVFEPLAAIAIVSLITSWIMQPYLVHALVEQGSVAQHAAQGALWLSGVLSPFAAFGKALAAALVCWSCSVFLGERMSLAKLISIFCVAEVVFSLRDLTVAGVLVARGVGAVHTTADLMVAFGVNAFVRGMSPLQRISVETWDFFTIAWAAVRVRAASVEWARPVCGRPLCSRRSRSPFARCSARRPSCTRCSHRDHQQIIPADMTPRIALRQFAVRYPSFTLSPVSLEIQPGERIALVGPNGAGKSTTLRALAGRMHDYDGFILLDGRDLRSLLPLGRRDIGLLPETLAGYGWMTVRDHLAFLREFYPSWDAGYAAHLADSLGVPLDKPLGRLSKGTRVKASFIAAEAYRPPLLLLDEPTSGLDPAVRGELLGAILSSIDAQSDRVVLFSTHLLEDDELGAKRVLLLTNGALGLDATVADLREAHRGMSLASILYAALSRTAS